MRDIPGTRVNGWGERVNALCGARHSGLWIAVFYALLFGLAWSAIGVARFTPDSWAFFELSRTVFSDDFYRFNTFRSYFSDTYSASFPLGYPVILAVIQRLTVSDPQVAVAVNVVAAAATPWVILQIGRHIELAPLASLVAGTALLLYPQYFRELLAGRAIPVAVLAFLCGYLSYLSGRFMQAGVLLGLSALVRFDFLAHALAFQVALCLLEGWNTRRVLRVLGGFVLGIAPWIAYSQVHFGRLWVSDNSWVALSALPAFVVDYPAAYAVSAFEAPVQWLQRVLGNLPRLFGSLWEGALLYPLVPVLLVLVALNWFAIGKGPRRRVLACALLLFASLAPYLLTGYSNPRYFAPAFLCLTAVLLFATRELRDPLRLGVNTSALVFTVLLFTVLRGGYVLAQDMQDGISAAEAMRNQAAEIAVLAACHRKHPRHRFIFSGSGAIAASKYGALSGMPAALMPSNFGEMSADQKRAYFDAMSPHVLIDNLGDVHKCTAL